MGRSHRKGGGQDGGSDWEENDDGSSQKSKQNAGQF